ncbi:uncharacterized protein [Anabrus simplex]|uniref:uncharacterized protein isoform X2 n=1 Tax=Anabrus simplex TaxID=316456 RepID=UPI0035A2A1AF
METTLDMPQRLWARRLTLTTGLNEGPGPLDHLFPPAQEVQTACKSTSDDLQLPSPVNGPARGSIPSCYVGSTVQVHEFPVIGSWVDPRIVPGFRYRVRLLTKQVHLFEGHALTLQSIGRGYGSRITFEADDGCLNDNRNYLWSDSWPEGLAFELEVVSPGDKFTLYNVNHIAAGTLEVLNVQAPQVEVSHTVVRGCVQKKVRLSLLCKVEWFENDLAPVIVPVNGLALVTRTKVGQTGNVVKVVNVCIGNHLRRGFTMTPGVSDKCRRITVRGNLIGDIPTCYTITGLEAHELPVIGTFIDPRIVPGFCYKVRPAGSKRPLFSGRSLCLLSIGAGYGKRITFEPDPTTLNAPENYFWSDSHPDGLGFEPRAVHAGMKFAVVAGGQCLGEASVFRADAAQQEERQEWVKGEKGNTLVKYIHIDVTCHVVLQSAPDPQAMRVSGTAVMARFPGFQHAKLLRVENVGLDSQLNLLFVTQQARLEFYPL